MRRSQLHRRKPSFQECNDRSLRTGTVLVDMLAELRRSKSLEINVLKCFQILEKKKDSVSKEVSCLTLTDL